jgi:hypothetical protein
MSGTTILHWRVSPVTPPRPLRHCASCGATRAFHSSGKVRLNANGRLLDAWLIYKCEICARTWNRPLIERVPVSTVTPADLHAMQASAPDWVEERAFDLASLARHAQRIETESAVRVTAVGRSPSQVWTEAELVIEAAVPVALRLDRFLAAALGLSRMQLLRIVSARGLEIDDAKRLKRSLAGGVRLRFQASVMTEAVRANITVALRAPPAEVRP